MRTHNSTLWFPAGRPVLGSAKRPRKDSVLMRAGADLRSSPHARAILGRPSGNLAGGIQGQCEAYVGDAFFWRAEGEMRGQVRMEGQILDHGHGLL